MSGERLLTLEEQFERDEKLLIAIGTHLRDLEELLFVFQSDHEDRMYRLYYQSFKVYELQYSTANAAALLKLLETISETCVRGFRRSYKLEHVANSKPTTIRIGFVIPDQLSKHFFTPSISLK